MSRHDLVLHVGMPRSSAILRRALERLRPQLRALGIAYVGATEIDRLPHTAGWAGALKYRPKDASAFARELASCVTAERREAGALPGLRPVQTVLLSDRLLGHGRIGTPDAERLRPPAANAVAQVVQSLSARRVRIVLYTQRQDHLMEQSYLNRVRAGNREAFEEQFPYLFEPVLDYVDLVERLRAVPSVADVVVRPIELADAGSHAFVNDFLTLFGLAGALDLYAMGGEVLSYPATYSARGARLALAMNPILETPEEHRAVNGYLTSHYLAGEQYNTELLDRATRRRILDSYDASNRALFTRYMPDLPVDSYSDDTATFALGNVLAPPAPSGPPLAVKVRTAAATRATTAAIALDRRARPVARRLRRAVRTRGRG